MATDDRLDEALAFLAPFGPDLASGLTNHGPMAAEALEAPVTSTSGDDLVERAIASGDEHAIKLAEAARREDLRAPATVHRTAVGRATELLSRGP